MDVRHWKNKKKQNKKTLSIKRIMKADCDVRAIGFLLKVVIAKVTRRTHFC